MQRIAFKMKLKPGKAAEYKKRHDQIWPELLLLLKDSGISDYAIFLDEETNSLFAVQKVAAGQGSQQLGQSPVVRKWWTFMADLMETNPDHSPVTIPLTEVFYMN